MLRIRYYIITCLLVSLIENAISDCPFPKKHLTNGRYLYQSPEHGVSTVAPENYLLQFRCFLGFTMKGSKSIVCLSNRWTDRVPSCLKMKCVDPPKVLNSNYTLYSGVNNPLTIGTEAIYTCNPGYELENSTDSILTCTLYSDINDVQWRGTTPRCIGPYDVEHSANRRDILKEETQQKRKVEIYHKPLFQTQHKSKRAISLEPVLDINFPGTLIFYFIFDVSRSIGEVNFRKSIEFAKATVKKVGISKNKTRFGALTFSCNTEIQFLPVESETTEDVLAALDKLKHTGGRTGGISALNLIRESLIPVTQVCLSGKGMKSIIFIFTDGKENMGSESKVEAELLKKAGVEIYSIGITDSVFQDSLFVLASEPKHNHVFILDNNATVSYLTEEIANETADYSKCGLRLENKGKTVIRGKVIGGGQVKEPWPWMAALFSVKPELQAKGKNYSFFLCGGSIIHESFILTAAHCMYWPGSLRRRVEREIIVQLGLTDRKNQSSLQEFEVQKIIIHPSYRHGLIFDYDIALLQLKRPIEFTALIRPICLPPIELPPDTNFYKAYEDVVAIGWGYAEVVQIDDWFYFNPVDQLKEIILPIQSQENCRRIIEDRNDLYKKAFSERMICAGDGRGGNDTCQGDSGGPLMQSLLNEDGYIYWTQVGIVSWGLGCGVANTYGYYTHVQKLVEWVTNNIQPKI